MWKTYVPVFPFPMHPARPPQDLQLLWMFLRMGVCPPKWELIRDSAEPMGLGVFMAPIFTQTSFYLVRTQNWCVIPCDNALSSIP